MPSLSVRIVAVCSILGLLFGGDAIAHADSMVLAPAACRPTGLRDLEIAVTDATGTARCDADAVDRAGNLLKVVTMTTPGTGSRVIDFGWALNTCVDRGHFQVICHLPADAKIHSIYYDEI